MLFARANICKTKRGRAGFQFLDHKEGVPSFSARTEMSLQLVSVLLVSYVSLTACAVQQSSPEAGVGGLLPGRRYEYSYSSEATVYLHANISLQAKVSRRGVKVTVWGLPGRGK